MSKELNTLSITEAAHMFERGETTSLALTRACLAEIEKRNPTLNVYLEVFADAEAQARAADERRAEAVAKERLQAAQDKEQKKRDALKASEAARTLLLVDWRDTAWLSLRGA